jgi:hypothetical protein
LEFKKAFKLNPELKLHPPNYGLRAAQVRNGSPESFHRLRKSAICTSKRRERAKHGTAFSLFGDLSMTGYQINATHRPLVIHQSAPDIFDFDLKHFSADREHTGPNRRAYLCG